MHEAFQREQERIWRDAVLAGDRLAWQQGYDAAYESLAGYIRWRCGGLRDLYEDVVQETWLVAVRSIHKFDPRRGSFLDWLRGIAANLIRNHLRKRIRRGPHESIDCDLPDPQDTPEFKQDRAEKIAHALAVLSYRHEQVLRAKYVEGRSVREIALAWGESEKAIESLLSRARMAFRESYGTDE